MNTRLAGAVLAGVFVAAAAGSFRAAEPIRYTFTFPEPEHHWMQVEAVFPDLPAAPLDLRFSRSSPGRYALHEFAKNVYDVHVYGADGQELTAARPDASAWVVSAHPQTVTVRYRVYGDRVDGTYLAVDETHAHINMPAGIMWARTLEDRPAILSFEPPAGRSDWQVATQLHPEGRNPRTFTAPNLQYLVDSPVEFGPIVVQPFTVGGRSFRFAAHQTGTPGELRAFVDDVVVKIVEQERSIFGEFPVYEPGSYTFLADYLPYATGDGMEHRNSAVVTSPGSIDTARFDLAGTVAHEFFHSWNVERIRPKDLEPFDLERANTSADLWLAEGFTEYFGPLVLQRAGLVSLAATTRQLTEFVDTAVAAPGRRVRSAEEMSRMAVFTDGARPLDRTNWSATVVSYYPMGAAIALAMDLSLRERSDGRVSLDDFMRTMWQRFGAPGGAVEGSVDHPYSTADAEAVLASVSGDEAFARTFFDRYVRGREVPDFGALLGRAGFAVQPEAPGRAWLGDVEFGAGAKGAVISGIVAPTWPLYAAGIDEDDEIQRIDGERIVSASDIVAALRRRKPGDRVEIAFMTRAGTPRTGAVVLAANPHVEVLPLDRAGGSLTAAQLAFRQRWLGPK